MHVKFEVSVIMIVKGVYFFNATWHSVGLIVECNALSLLHNEVAVMSYPTLMMQQIFHTLLDSLVHASLCSMK